MNWIIVTIFAAFLQNLRFSLQKNINKKISTVASTYVRFVFSLPFTLILFFGYFQNTKIITDLLTHHDFIFYLVSGSIAQIIFTSLLLYLFQFSNFIVGTSLSKTEVIQIAILELIIMGDKLNSTAVAGIILSTVGIIVFTVKNINLFFKNLFSKTTFVGLLTGFFLGLSVVCFRAASLSLKEFDSNFDKALCTLFFSVVFQTIIMTIYIYFFQKDQFKKLYINKYECLAAGFAGFLATLSWFYAFTLIQSSIVRAVGQIELLFSYFSSRYVFKEKISKIELFGISIFILGLIILLLHR